MNETIGNRELYEDFVGVSSKRLIEELERRGDLEIRVETLYGPIVAKVDRSGDEPGIWVLLEKESSGEPGVLIGENGERKLMCHVWDCNNPEGDPVSYKLSEQMTRSVAEKILREEGWNEEGLEVILDDIAPSALEKMEYKDLINLSDDYKNR